MLTEIRCDAGKVLFGERHVIRDTEGMFLRGARIVGERSCCDRCAQQAQAQGRQEELEAFLGVVGAADPATEAGWLVTSTGRAVWPLDPARGEVVVEDIAHALARIAHWGGHAARTMSVAEHSLWVALVLLDDGTLAETALAGLLHDAAEAYLGDISRPLKAGLLARSGAGAPLEVRALEAGWLRRILRELAGVESGDADPLPRQVHEADCRILATEARDVMGSPAVLMDLVAQGVRPEPWRIGETMPAEIAEQTFLTAYELLHRGDAVNGRRVRGYLRFIQRQRERKLWPPQPEIAARA